jgi:hypothetical protein
MRQLWRRLGFPRERCGENEALLQAADRLKDDYVSVEHLLMVQ